MKTQKKTLRGTITSSILALALAGGLLPANAIAYAATAAGPQINQDESIVADGSTASANANEAAESSADSAATGTDAASNATDTSAAPAGSQEVADGVYKLDDQGTATATDGEAATQLLPQYTTTVQGHTSAELRLEGQAQPAAGTIEYGGLAYTIDPEDPSTAKVTGLATDKPKGDVQVQAQVASNGKLYSVTGIEIAGGGGN